MKSLIICGFTGIGKSFFAKKHDDAIDIDSASISRSQFAQKYMAAINNSYSLYRYILVSTHKSIRDEVAKDRLPAILVYPDITLKNDYLVRLLSRGNSYEYVKEIDGIWDTCIKELAEDCRFRHLVLSKGQFLSDCDLTTI